MDSIYYASSELQTFRRYELVAPSPRFSTDLIVFYSVYVCSGVILTYHWVCIETLWVMTLLEVTCLGIELRLIATIIKD